MKKAYGNKANSKKWQTAKYKSCVQRVSEQCKMWVVSEKKRASDDAARNKAISKMWGLS